MSAQYLYRMNTVRSVCRPLYSILYNTHLDGTVTAMET
jgi:hypothetical protein